MGVLYDNAQVSPHCIQSTRVVVVEVVLWSIVI
jgi:hypothetical protein